MARHLTTFTALAVTFAALGSITVLPRMWRQRAIADRQARLEVLAAAPGLACGSLLDPGLPAASGTGALGGAALSSWQTIGGCGAGASSGTGAGVKWVGRNVTGGLFRVECQANYVDTPYGYNYVGTTLVSADLGEDWNLGVSVPYLYKYMQDPYKLGFDVRNRGLGDVTGLLTYQLGPINATSLTLSVSAPTGIHDATLVRDKTILLPQDRQLGLGKPSGALTLDHTMDHLWGLSVLGGMVSWRGGENDLGSYRAPSAAAYAYTSYLLGPFAPAIGLQVTGFSEEDRDLQATQQSPLLSLAANVSLEWSTDWLAVLVGASLPYQYVDTSQQNARALDGWGLGPWVVALGLAFAPL